jgi:hypothetical protein
LLLVDEAQNLPVGSIEELRLLANYQSEGRGLFQSFLLGQNRLRRTLQTANMAQMRQRIIASYHLEPLSREETRSYIEHRLGLAGWQQDPVLEEDVFEGVFEAAGGVPRLINTLCDRLLLFGCVEEKHNLNRADLDAVVEDMQQGVAAGEVANAERIEDGQFDSTCTEQHLRQRVGSLDVHGGEGVAREVQTEHRWPTEEAFSAAHFHERLVQLEAEVSRLNKLLRRERALVRKAILSQLDVLSDDELE